MPLRIDDAPLRRLGREFARLAADSPKQIRQAVGSIRRAAQTESGRAIRQAYNVKLSGLEVQRSRSGKKAGLEVGSGDLSVTITGHERPLSAERFAGTRATKKGLRIQVTKGGRASVIRRGFESKKKRVLFIRETSKRLPIRKATGPSVADMLANEKVRKTLIRTLGDRAVKELERRVLRLRAR